MDSDNNYFPPDFTKWQANASGLAGRIAGAFFGSLLQMAQAFLTAAKRLVGRQ